MKHQNRIPAIPDINHSVNNNYSNTKIESMINRCIDDQFTIA